MRPVDLTPCCRDAHPKADVRPHCSILAMKVTAKRKGRTLSEVRHHRRHRYRDLHQGQRPRALDLEPRDGEQLASDEATGPPRLEATQIPLTTP